MYARVHDPSPGARPDSLRARHPLPQGERETSLPRAYRSPSAFISMDIVESSPCLRRACGRARVLFQGAGYACRPCPRLERGDGGAPRGAPALVLSARAIRARGRLAALHRGVFTTASGRAFRAGARPAAVSRLPAGTRSGPGRSPDAARGRAGEARTRAPRPSPAKQRPAERPLRGRNTCENIPRLRREYDGDDHFTIGSGGPSLQGLREPQACLPSQYWDISRWPGR